MSNGAAQHTASFHNKWDLEKTSLETIARSMLTIEDGLLLALPPAATKSCRRPLQRAYDLSFLFEFPARTREALAISHTLRLCAIDHADARYNEHRIFSGDFANFLRQSYNDLKLFDIDEVLIVRFERWLEQRSLNGSGAAVRTLREKVFAVQRTLKYLARSGEFKAELSRDFRLIKKPFRDYDDDTRHKEPIKDGSFEDAYACAEADCRKVMIDLEPKLDEISRLRRKPIHLETAGRNAVRCACFLLQAFPDRLAPTWRQMGKLSPTYHDHVTLEMHEAAERLLYPRLEEFAPYLVLLAAAFALNPGTLLGMTVRDFTFERFGGVERLKISPAKGRANWKRQRHAVTVTSHHDNPGRVVRFVDKRTLFLREASADDAGLLFIRFFARRREVVQPRLDDAWTKAIDAMARRHRLERFTLEQVRPTILQKVHELTGGDITAVQAFGHQSSMNTLDRSYRTPGMVRSGEDRLYAAMALRHRDIETDGLITPLDRPKNKVDRWAATPGYTCLDTFDSPISGQKKGRPCLAYGQCPRCELAMTDRTSATDFAYLNQLRRRIDETAETIGPQAWLEKWAPVQREVLIDIAMFTGDPEAAMRDAVVSILPPLE